jgi:hypothetical protein
LPRRELRSAVDGLCGVSQRSLSRQLQHDPEVAQRGVWPVDCERHVGQALPE